MNFNRDSRLWTVTFISALAVFLSGHFDLITKAIPFATAAWQARIELTAAVTGFVAAYMRMSPAPLSPNSPMAGTSDTTNVLTTRDQLSGAPKPEGE